METKLIDIAQPIFLFASTFGERIERGEDPSPEDLKTELLRSFASMDNLARQQPVLNNLYEKKFRFGLIALADEVIDNSNWSGKDFWQPLEMEMQGTQIAGDHVYEMIDELGPADQDLIEGFFYILSLGFRGKYMLDEGAWGATLKKLYDQIPKPPGMHDFRLTPDAYRVQPKRSVKLDPLFSLWRSIILGVICFVMVIVFYQVVWHTAVSDSRKTAQSIVDSIGDERLQDEYKETFK